MLTAKQDTRALREGSKVDEHAWIGVRAALGINAEGYPGEGDKTQARSYAEHCLIVAKEQGVSKKEIEETKRVISWTT